MEEKKIVIRKDSKALIDYLEGNAKNIIFADNIDQRKEDLDGLVEILSAEVKGKPNNKSIVIRVQHDIISCLIPGDAEGEIEQNLEEQEINSNIHILSHHGSTTCGTNSKQFLANVGAKYYAVSSGMYGRYCHPPFEMYEILKSQQKITKSDKKIGFTCFKDKKLTTFEICEAIYHTYDCGNIEFVAENGEIKVSYSKEKKN